MIEDKHLNIRTIQDLAKYLRKVLHEFDDLDMTTLDGNSLRGYANGEVFYIEFYYDKYKNGATIHLSVEQTGGGDLLEVLERKIAPVMWGANGQADPSEKKPFYASKILSYEFVSLTDFCLNKSIVWDTIDPKKTIVSFLKELELNSSKIFGEEIFYPYIDIDKLMKSYYYGVFTGSLKPETVKRIKSMSEFELFYEIRRMIEKIEAIEQDENQYKNLTDEIYTNFDYVMSFMYAQTKKFGVPGNPPCPEYVEPTIEQCAWYDMWNSFLDRALDDNPNLIEEWSKKFEGGFDPDFGPKMNVMEYLGYYQTKCEMEEDLEEEQARAESQERLLEVLRKIKNKKIEDEKRAKTIEGRADSLFDEMYSVSIRDKYGLEKKDTGLNFEKI